jgi:hypothetical protein
MHKRREAYLAHLQSQYWAEVRQLIFAAQSGICSKCGLPMELGSYEVNHKNYDFVGREKDCLGSCEALHPLCHRKLHHTDWAYLPDIDPESLVPAWGE